ncbi:MAG: macro domain-containing protein [Bacteroidales bacterium]|jgi:O-acetyl-ADP-ribose deacetylase (regulator of RNase III)/uncharacterized protein YwgA|nr:macro domain-containing protein [Bacteroidales bacterium]
MIEYLKGNILESDAKALVNTVNTMGIMGKGIALQFKKNFPRNFKAYVDACKRKEIVIGKMFVTCDCNITTSEKIIINFPTKKDWRKSSEYSFIEHGLDDFIQVIKTMHIKSVAIPPLGAGNGGLEWEKVKIIIENKLSNLDVKIYVYEPTLQIKEELKKERAKLTEARALLLYILYDLIRNGAFVSEFSSEKICYFLQKFGAEKFFKLKFIPNIYGPYSGKVRFVLNHLNGSYIMGYTDMNKKPFETLTIVADGYEDVKKYVENNDELKGIADRTMTFFDGAYSDFELELLSSIDFIIAEKQTLDREIIKEELNRWNNRKRGLFSKDRYIDLAINHLKQIYQNLQ